MCRMWLVDIQQEFKMKIVQDIDSFIKNAYNNNWFVYLIVGIVLLFLLMMCKK